jgi:hypothetical protein
MSTAFASCSALFVMCAVTLLSGCQAVRADLNSKYIVCKRVVQDADAKRGFVYKVTHH